MDDMCRKWAGLLVLAAPAIFLVGCGTTDAGSGTVSGVVSDAQGDPAAGCSVSAEPTSHPRPAMNERGYGTDDEGWFFMVLPSATYTMRVLCHGGEGETSTVRIEEEVTDVVVTDDAEVTVNFQG
ncbi:carboxypeptidase-like regulatory domain-containing protein [Nocardiopsis sp. NPDC058631]|uniref:carboxypeptidase-like regulatory domain-containing protein n=1 Tax=Nocardiopsis sp. NPDC058631 TaxID=3346566 RepID=UPI0036594A7F